MSVQPCQQAVTQLMHWVEPDGYVFIARCACGWSARHEDDAESTLAVCRHIEGTEAAE